MLNYLLIIFILYWQLSSELNLRNWKHMEGETSIVIAKIKREFHARISIANK